MVLWRVSEAFVLSVALSLLDEVDCMILSNEDADCGECTGRRLDKPFGLCCVHARHHGTRRWSECTMSSVEPMRWESVDIRKVLLLKRWW